MKSSASIVPSSRFLTSSFTLATVSDDCLPLVASFINVDRKFLHFFTFSIVSVVGDTVVPVAAVTVLWAVPAGTDSTEPTEEACTGGLWSVVVAVLLAVGEPCFMIVVGVTCRAISGVPGACAEVICPGAVLVGAAGRVA